MAWWKASDSPRAARRAQGWVPIDSNLRISLSCCSGAAWNGRVLRVTVPVLAPGGVLRVVYTARVRADLAPAAVLVNRAVATAAGGLQAAALVVLGQPPLELPRTGSGGSPGGGLR